MNQVRVGVSVILHTPWGYPMLLRAGSHGAGTWCFPGGHLEHGESVLGCALRELQEELAVTPDHMSILPWITEDSWQPDLHYITLYVHAHTSQMPVNQEDHKCAQIQFVDGESEDLAYVLGGDVFGGCAQAWQNYRTWQSNNSV
jgi:8-oxo-dGTP diphosphatase